LLAGCAGVLTSPLVASAQQAGKVYRLGLLFSGDPAARPQFEGLRQGLRDLGYWEGQNLNMELRTAVGFALVPPTEPKLRLLHRWVDCWRGDETTTGDHGGQWIAVFYVGTRS
jgi:hypothetical protein